MTIYLSASDILDINEKFVGPDQLRDFGLLDGAVMRPQASAFGEDAFPSIHEKAAALLHGLARNHPFVTGNKRTAWTATAMFYMVNGCNLHVDASDVLRLTTEAAEDKIGVQDVAGTLKDWAQPFPTADDWMDSPSDVFRAPEDIEDQIKELEKGVDTLLAGHGITHELRQSLRKLHDDLNEMGEAMLEHVKLTGELPSEEALEPLREMRESLVNIDVSEPMPPSWIEWVDSHAAFAFLDPEVRLGLQRRSRKQRSSKRRNSKGQRRKRARRR